MVAMIICCAAGLATASILLLASLYFLFRSHFSSSTYFDVAYRRHRAHRNQSPVHLSVIYKVRSRTLALKDQLMCLASLVRHDLGPDYTFEIVCVVSPAKPHLLWRVTALCKELGFIVLAARETAGIRWLLNGAVLSRGQTVVDARFLADQIDLLAGNRGGHFCVFGQTEAGRQIPILFSKDAAVAVFGRLHWLSIGYAEEMLIIARRMNIQIISVRVRAGREPRSVVERAIVGAVVEITRLMDAKRVWSADIGDSPI